MLAVSMIRVLSKWRGSVKRFLWFFRKSMTFLFSTGSDTYNRNSAGWEIPYTELQRSADTPFLEVFQMCPLCGSKRVRQSRRQPRDLVLMFLRAKPMRCRTCSYRYHVWPWTKPVEVDLPAAVKEAQQLIAMRAQKRAAATASSGKQ